MVVAKRQKIGDSYSKFYYLYDTNKEGLPSNKILESKIIGEAVSDNPDEVFEVKLDAAGAYIVTKEGEEFDTGFTSSELKRFFYCQI